MRELYERLGTPLPGGMHFRRLVNGGIAVLGDQSAPGMAEAGAEKLRAKGSGPRQGLDMAEGENLEKTLLEFDSRRSPQGKRTSAPVQNSVMALRRLFEKLPKAIEAIWLVSTANPRQDGLAQWKVGAPASAIRAMFLLSRQVGVYVLVHKCELLYTRTFRAAGSNSNSFFPI